MLLALIATHASAYILQGVIPLRTARSVTSCVNANRPKAAAGLRMGYLDNINSDSQNLKGKDSQGKQVMPSFEEYLEVGHYSFSVLLRSLPAVWDLT